MNFEIKQTRLFEKRYKEIIPISVRPISRKKILRLKENAHKKGKPIRYSFFRELRTGKFRFYYMILEYKNIVLLVNVSDKKTQQKIINQVLKSKEFLTNLVSENSSEDIKTIRFNGDK